MKHRISLSAALALLGAAAPAVWAADVTAGKAVAQAKCAACHEPADWQGETPNSLQSLIRDVVSGKVKHNKSKIDLNETDIENVAAYWLAGKKK